MIYSNGHLKMQIEKQKARSIRTGSPLVLILVHPCRVSRFCAPRQSNKLVARVEEMDGLNTCTPSIHGWLSQRTYAWLGLETPPDKADLLAGKLDRVLEECAFPSRSGRRSMSIYTFPPPVSKGSEREGRTLHFIPQRNFLYSVSKRTLDLSGAAFLLCVLLPLLLAIALLVRLDSPGGAIFRQTRIGAGGRPFNFLKFRTMFCDCDQRIHQEHVESLMTKRAGLCCVRSPDEKTYKLVQDHRITRVGAILRKTSLDELPQLLNVLRGEMSLVGPRPHPTYEAELYSSWQRRRLEVKPGITGYGQVNGRYNREYEDVFRLDLQYVKHASFGMDLKILFMTIPAILSRNGAY